MKIKVFGNKERHPGDMWCTFFPSFFTFHILNDSDNLIANISYNKLNIYHLLT